MSRGNSYTGGKEKENEAEEMVGGAEGKLAIVMEGLKEKTSVAGICREHKISQTLYYRWRDKFFEGGRKTLGGGLSDDTGSRAEMEKLQKIIGKQAIQIEILKKTEELFGRTR